MLREDSLTGCAPRAPTDSAHREAGQKRKRSREAREARLQRQKVGQESAELSSRPQGSAAGLETEQEGALKMLLASARRCLTTLESPPVAWKPDRRGLKSEWVERKWRQRV